VDKIEGMDIDAPDDFKMVEIICRKEKAEWTGQMTQQGDKKSHKARL
jgi:hypothetical protein